MKKERNEDKSNGSCDVGDHGSQHLSGGTGDGGNERIRWQKMEHIRRLHMSQEQRMMMKMNGMNMMSDLSL